MKSYTNIEQSKELAKILPPESADMARCGGENVIVTNYISAKKKFSACGEITITPCWSLSALISILPFHLIANNRRYAFSMVKGFNKNGETYAIKYYAIFNSAFYYHMTDFYNSPIDAAFEMVCWLKENNKL